MEKEIIKPGATANILDPKISSEMIDAAIGQDPDAREELYRRSYNGVYHIVKSVIRDEERALDLIQDIYYEVLTSLPDLKEGANFQLWVNRRTEQMLLSSLKKRDPKSFADMAKKDYPCDFSGNFPRDPGGAPLERQETRSLLNQLMAALTPAQQITCCLFYCREMSPHSIARFLDCSENAVMNCLLDASNSLQIEAQRLEQRGTDLMGLSGMDYFLWLIYTESQMLQIASRAVSSKLTLRLPDDFSQRAKRNFAENTGSGKNESFRDQMDRKKKNRKVVRRYSDVVFLILGAVALIAVIIGAIMMKDYPLPR